MKADTWQLITFGAAPVLALIGWALRLIFAHRKEAREEFNKLWDDMNNQSYEVRDKITHREAGELVDLKLAPLERSLTHVSEELSRNTAAMERLRESLTNGQS